MKKTAVLLFLMLAVTAFGQIVKSNQMGPFTIGMKLSEAEKASKQKIKFTKQQAQDYDYSKTLTVNGVDYELYFYDEYDDKGNVSGKTIGTISSKNPKIKTTEGIGIGSSKNDIINAYPLADLSIYYDVNDNDVRSKTDCFVNVSHASDSDNEGAYTFEIKNNKVTMIRVSDYDSWD